MKRAGLLAVIGWMLMGWGGIVQASADPASMNSDSAGIALAKEEGSVLFKPGEGGDSAWWESRLSSVRGKDEKTAAGLVVAILKRDLGVTGERPAGVDAYLAPTPGLKKKLAIYDVSSPSVKEIRFNRLEKDQSGTLYDFQVIGGTSADNFQGFEGMLRIHIAKRSHLVDDIPTATLDPKPSTNE
ncbi:hypothetical protein [Cohnella panacarvi]|uniref:hypothetical protein n=1 Tax=Cohnella panacarvi TaxID=400776 RepID=UPI00047A9D2C|nr:hypothetical protein [Cohnella panacarvi]